MRIPLAGAVRSSCIAGVAAALILGGSVSAATAAENTPTVSRAQTAASPANSGPADGIYYLELTGTHVLTKTTTCAQGAGGWANYVLRDASKFSQKWRLIKQQDGSYIVASECQPTVLMSDGSDSDDYLTFEYGVDGPTSALGSWNQNYDYRVAPAENQKWWITKSGPSPDGYEFRSAVSNDTHYFSLASAY